VKHITHCICHTTKLNGKPAAAFKTDRERSRTVAVQPISTALQKSSLDETITYVDECFRRWSCERSKNGAKSMEVEETGLRQFAAMCLKRQLTVDDDSKIFDGVQTNERQRDSSKLYVHVIMHFEQQSVASLSRALHDSIYGDNCNRNCMKLLYLATSLYRTWPAFGSRDVDAMEMFTLRPAGCRPTTLL